MKWFILPVLLVFLMPATQAALVDWNVEISLNDDKTSDWIVSLTYNETIQKTSYFLLANIVDYNVTVDGNYINCKLDTSAGSSFECDNFSASVVKFHFKTTQITRSFQNLRMFEYKFSVFQLTDRFRVSIKLPLGAPLADENQLGSTGLKPFEPEFGQQGSDGRRILVSWILDNPTLGKTMSTSVVYENLEQAQIDIFIFIISGLVIAFLIFLYYIFRSRHVRRVLPILTDNERKIVEILLRENGKVDQRQLVKETDFSKAKVSRIITDLVKRGIIEKESKGRKNIIRLKKSIKQEKTANLETPKK